MESKDAKGSTRREFLTQAAGAALISSLPTTAFAAPKGRNGKPLNVLFIMSDDMCAELNCYKSRFPVHSPNLDALAKRGVMFERNYCQFPICNPSRASLLTGKTVLSTKVLGNGTNFRKVSPDLVSLPQHFQAHGYATPRVGKIFHGGFDDPKAWTVGGGNVELQGTQPGKTKEVARGPVPPQPDDVLPPLPGDIKQAPNSDRIIILEGNGEGHPEYMVADKAIEYLRTYKGQPFFIGCGFSKPHSPPTAPQRFLDMYDLDKITLPADFQAWPTVPPGFPKAAIRMLNADLFIGRGASESEAKEVIRAYLASISWADWNIGRVLAELDAQGLRDSTIVVFVADHGYQLGEKGKWSKAGSLFEMGTRVPLIIDAPGMSGNRHVVTSTVQSLDIFPTLMELCGLPAPEGLEGKSLVPLLKQPHAAWGHPAFSIWSEDGHTVHGIMVRNEKWRYAEFGEAGKNGAMLFDVHADPTENKNLADDPQHKQTRAELSELLRKYLAQEIA